MLRKKRGKLSPSRSSIVLHLAPILQARNISNGYTYLTKLGISNTSAVKMLDGRSVQINYKQLTALCMGLNCTPNDLFALRQMDLPSHHALNALPDIADASPHKSIAEWLQGKSLEEVKKLMEE